MFFFIKEFQNSLFNIQVEEVVVLVELLDVAGWDEEVQGTV